MMNEDGLSPVQKSEFECGLRWVTNILLELSGNCARWMSPNRAGHLKMAIAHLCEARIPGPRTVAEVQKIHER